MAAAAFSAGTLRDSVVPLPVTGTLVRIHFTTVPQCSDDDARRPLAVNSRPPIHPTVAGDLGRLAREGDGRVGAGKRVSVVELIEDEGWNIHFGDLPTCAVVLFFGAGR